MAACNNKIDRFDGPYRFLSNFYPCRVFLGRATYSSVEHAYQAAKTTGVEARRTIQRAPTPGIAKRLGRTVRLRDDWEQVKEGVMLDLLRQKFADGELRRRLSATGTALLEEGNHWGDDYWGICNGKGRNRLGVLLMQVRDELQLVGGRR